MKIERLEGGELWLHDSHATVADTADILIMGPSWMLECIEIESGTFAYTRDGRTTERGTGVFGLFLPAFSVAEIRYSRMRWSWVGFSAPATPPAAWLDAPMLFELESHGLPRNRDELLHLVASPRPAHPLARTSCPSSTSRRAKALIDTSYRDQRTIAAMAATLGVSQAHLTREFTRDYGRPPAQYRRQLRIVDANERLFRGDGIADVAFDVGYNDVSRFYHAFRDVCEAPPGAIKKRQDAMR